MESFKKSFNFALMKKSRLFLIDGHALIFKMYYAFQGRPMVNAKGVDTSILFGTAKYLFELIAREQPSHLAVAFDPPGGCFRNVLYPQYKANRAETPQLVIDALEPLKAMVEAMRIPVLMESGFEADDVVGTAAKRFGSDDCDVFMVTPDKDYGQLVSSCIHQYKPGKSGSDNEILGPAEVCAKWNIESPSQVIDMLAICGDSADNVPGVQGVGPVGASKLLNRFGSIDGIYSHLSELTPRQQTQFEAARDHIGLSRELVTIRTDVALDCSLEDMLLQDYNTPELNQWLVNYEMPSLLRMLSRLAPTAPEAASVSSPKPSAALSYNTVGYGEFVPSARSAGRLAVLMPDSGEQLYLAAGDKLCCSSAAQARELLEDESLAKCGEDLKGLYRRLAAKGIELRGKLLDVSIMHYVLNPEGSHSLQTLSLSLLGVDLEEGQLAQGDLFGQTEDAPDSTCDRRCFIAGRIADILASRMDETARKLYDDVEAPLIRVLAKMEARGVRIDLGSLKTFAEGLRKSIAGNEELVRSVAGNPDLNLSSPKQVGELLFAQLKLAPGIKRARNGNFPTDEQTLSEIEGDNPVVDAILQYRGDRKLLGTYIDPFPSYVNPADGRVHTTFNQSLTATGRLSSSNPNLQNIPVRTEQGREIRRAFVPGGEDCLMMAADYSQIELRIMAHLCGDKHLREAFLEGRDVHAATAAKVFHKALEDVSADERRAAKAVNFGIMYGMSSFGLSQRLKCSRSEAKAIIDDYFRSFPDIRDFIDTTLAVARETGYVETIFGRRRYVSELNSRNANVKAAAERNAVNAPIQGSAADIIKLAMIAVDRRLEEEGYGARMVLQIHDELLLEVPAAELEAVSALLREEMEGVVRLSVPLTVECNYGKNWLEAH